VTSQRESLLEELERTCRDLGYGLNDFLEEKLTEARARRFLKLIPAHHLSEREIEQYLSIVLRRIPSKDDVASISTVSQRRTRISEDERVRLERAQNDRCAVCGRFLDSQSHPHVDHRVPVALGGSNASANLQLLCGDCNLGKGAVPVWSLGVPWLDTRLSKRLRYCALSRANGACQHPRCEQTVATSELTLVPIVPLSVGGTLRFDNLSVMCTTHAQGLRDSRSSAAQAALRARYSPSSSRVSALRKARG
jgi:5-methylcytosine-specific restriction endonuclease McrA